MTDYKPGTVAVICAPGRIAEPTEWRAVKDDKGWSSLDPEIGWVGDMNVTDVRPLVVLDLPVGAKGGWPVLVHALEIARDRTGLPVTFGGLIDQIEAQTAPPKPAEPTGLGAVVKDSEGGKWVRHEVIVNVTPWRLYDQCWRAYADIDAVEVLSEGVTLR